MIAFCTLGVGQPSKVSKEELHRVDVEYSSAFAQACRQAGVEHISLLTAVNTSADSSLYYSRVKAEVPGRLPAFLGARVREVPL